MVVPRRICLACNSYEPRAVFLTLHVFLSKRLPCGRFQGVVSDTSSWFRILFNVFIRPSLLSCQLWWVSAFTLQPWQACKFIQIPEPLHRFAVVPENRVKLPTLLLALHRSLLLPVPHFFVTR